MKIGRRTMTAGTSFLVAAAIGQFMQSGARVVVPPAAAPVQVASPVKGMTVPPDAEIVDLSAELTERTEGTLPDLPDLDGTAFANTWALGARMRAVETGRVALSVPSDDAFSAFGIACGASRLAVKAEPKAMLNIVIDAPCHENQAVTIMHAGLRLSYRTDVNGRVGAVVPAFDAGGEVTATFPGDESISAAAAVDDLGEVTRIAVVSPASQPVALNIYENGAEFGQPGHLTATHPRNTKSRRGGQMFGLGDPEIGSGYVAEIYQFSSRTKSVRIEIAAESTGETCGSSVSGRSIMVQRGQRESHDLMLAMPECDGLGGTVALDITSAAPVKVAANSD